MRKRIADLATVAPKPCTHPLVTFDGVSQFACLWGYSEAFAIPTGPAGDEMDKARREHHAWGADTRQHVRADLLGPSGEPFPGRQALWVYGPEVTSNRNR